MKSKYILFIIVIALLTIFLSACAGGAATLASSWPGLTINDQVGYVAYNQLVSAINLENGTEKWRFPATPNAKITFYAQPVMSADGQLIVGGYNHILYSLNPENGQVNWQFEGATNRYIASPLVTDNAIYIPNADKNVYALDLKGNLLWTLAIPGEAWSAPILDPNCDCMYLSSLDHRIYAIDPQKGTIIWQTNDLGGSVVGTPTLSSDGTLYVGTFASELISLDSSNGEVIWRKPTDGWLWSSPTLDKDQLYIGDLSGYLYAFNAKDGASVWTVGPDKLDGEIVGSPLLTNDTLYINTKNGNLYSLDTSGNINWTQVIGGSLYPSPLANGEQILVTPIITKDPKELVVAVNSDGTKQWSYFPTTQK
jgi:outer membrane protein assembly factor BamB